MDQGPSAILGLDLDKMDRQALQSWSDQVLFPTMCFGIFGPLQNLMVVKTQPGLVSQYNKSASSEEAGKLVSP